MTRANKTDRNRLLHVDFPKANETIAAGHYAVRISAEHNATVEVSVDGSPYSPCHNSCGYWWYNMSELRQGPHKVMVRASSPGSDAILVLRKFTVGK